MKTFKEAKEAYIADHIAKGLKQPERRLNALKAIEKLVSEKSPELLSGNHLFKTYQKEQFEKHYTIWKNAPLSGAEKSVLLGLFKFSR
jgi:hypothetical protein